MIEGSGACTMQMIMNHMIRAAGALRGAFYTLGPLVTDIAPVMTITSGHGAAQIGMAWLRHARYVTPKEHLARRTRRMREGIITYKNRRACGGPGQGSSGCPDPWTMRCPKRVLSPAGEDQSQPGTGSGSGRASTTTRRRPSESAKVAHFCSMCGPKFCSMKISQDVRECHE